MNASEASIPTYIWKSRHLADGRKVSEWPSPTGHTYTAELQADQRWLLRCPKGHHLGRFVRFAQMQAVAAEHHRHNYAKIVSIPAILPHAN